jgi:hypothetical protein
MTYLFRIACVFVVLYLTVLSGLSEDIWDLEVVDAAGSGTHPNVGADPSNPDNKVIIEGIALNATQEYLDIANIWQIYVQAEFPDQGGIAVFSGVWWWGASWCPYPTDISAGDRIRVEGFIITMEKLT